jgi:hypothetical protein
MRGSNSGVMARHCGHNRLGSPGSSSRGMLCWANTRWLQLGKGFKSEHKDTYFKDTNQDSLFFWVSRAAVCSTTAAKPHLPKPSLSHKKSFLPNQCSKSLTSLVCPESSGSAPQSWPKTEAILTGQWCGLGGCGHVAQGTNKPVAIRHWGLGVPVITQHHSIG